MASQVKLFINVEDALNFIEIHKAHQDLHLYKVGDGGVKRVTGIKYIWADLLAYLKIDEGRGVEFQIIENAIDHLREDFGELKNPKIIKAIANLEGEVLATENKIARKESWSLEPLINELRRFRVALREDADLKLKRLKLILDSSSQKIEKLKNINQHSLPREILDFLSEIDDEIYMFAQSRQEIEEGYKVYSSFINACHAIDQEMEAVRESFYQRLPLALNWGVTLALKEMSENGIPELGDVLHGEVWDLNDAFVADAEKKYKQLKQLYLKYHAKLRKDLQGSFDNNFAEYEGRLYFAKQLLGGL